jgi:hypothetical protein
MKQYIYYSKLDKTQEPLGKISDANDEEDAAFQAAFKKRMNIEEFLNVFEIKEYERRKIQKSK